MDPFRAPKTKKKYIPDDQIVIPNSHIPLPKGGIKSYSMSLEKFKDLLKGIIINNSSLSTKNFESEICKIADFSPGVYFHKYGRLLNGFCYAMVIEQIKTNVSVFSTAAILYFDNTNTLKVFRPLMGNTINRITGQLITGSQDDIYWFWEETNWGAPRPHGPIKLDDSVLDRLVISFELIEKEIEARVKIFPKPDTDQVKLGIQSIRTLGDTLY